jgi:hypothetical protein
LGTPQRPSHGLRWRTCAANTIARSSVLRLSNLRQNKIAGGFSAGRCHGRAVFEGYDNACEEYNDAFKGSKYVCKDDKGLFKDNNSEYEGSNVVFKDYNGVNKRYNGTFKDNNGVFEGSNGAKNQGAIVIYAKNITKMRKLTPEEASEVVMLKKGRRTRLNIELSQLKAGEGIEIKKQTDWVGKRPPYRLISRFAKRHGWKIVATRAPDDMGWRVTRVE